MLHAYNALSSIFNLGLAEKILGIVGPKFGADRTGVMLAICDSGTGTTVCVPVGKFAKLERQKDCTRNALEKASRLLTSGEITSFESVNEKAKKYGGGVQFVQHHLIIAPSGLPPEGDEAYGVAFGATRIVTQKVMTGKLENDPANFSTEWMQDLDRNVDDILPFCKDQILVDTVRCELKEILTINDLKINHVL